MAAAVRDKRDPIAEKRTARAKREAAREQTFRAAAELFLDERRAGWSNPKQAAQWRSTLEAHAFPELGDLPCAAIGPADVLRCLSPIWREKPETASRVRGRIEAILDSAAARGWRDPAARNPAAWRGVLSALLPAARKVRAVRHRPALAWERMPEFWKALAAKEGASALALRFAILTAARSGEARGATWGEIDLPGRVWRIPGSRMKAGKPHSIPFSDAALAVLADAAAHRRHDGPDALLFPSPNRGAALSDMALCELLRGMCRDGLPEDAPPRWADREGRAVVVHGFRSSFRDWCGDNGIARELAEAALAHALPGVEAAYARSDLLERRRPVMEAWGRHVTGAGAAAVVRLRRR